MRQHQRKKQRFDQKKVQEHQNQEIIFTHSDIVTQADEYILPNDGDPLAHRTIDEEKDLNIKLEPM